MFFMPTMKNISKHEIVVEHYRHWNTHYTKPTFFFYTVVLLLSHAHITNFHLFLTHTLQTSIFFLNAFKLKSSMLKIASPLSNFPPFLSSLSQITNRIKSKELNIHNINLKHYVTHLYSIPKIAITLLSQKKKQNFKQKNHMHKCA